MWEWILKYSVWMLMGSAIALALLLAGKSPCNRRVARISDKARKARVSAVVDWVFWTLDGVVLLIVGAAAFATVVSREGAEALITPETVKLWFIQHGVFVLLIAAFSYLAYRAVKSGMPRLMGRYVTARGKGKRAQDEVSRRAQTLGGSITTGAGIVISIIAVLMILAELGVSVTPLLATAGVAGIAVGFGAQSFIKDVISGVLILMEDQYKKGDVVKVAGIVGLVEDINLRRTVLRDLDGIVHSVPNSEITTASNYTKEYSRINIDVPVAYGTDLDRAMEIINRVGNEMNQDPTFGPMIRTAPKTLGVNKFGDSGIDIKVLGDTRPLMQWDVGREFRRRVKRAFDEEGVEIPWPHVKLYFGGQQGGAPVLCPACGWHNQAGSSYCSACGSPVTRAPGGEQG
jgi:small-conductance mechanosensitive channel